MAWAAVGEAVDEPWIRVEVEDYGLVVREDGSVFSISQSVRMVAVRDKLGLLVLVNVNAERRGVP